MTRVLPLCLLLLAGCESSPYAVSNAIRFAYPSLGFAGAYTRQLTVDDVRQIVELARSNRTIIKPVQQIIVNKPGEAEVSSGPWETGKLGTTFEVRKESGRWIIVPGSINTGESIITS
jgi:hypothetical protein